MVLLSLCNVQGIQAILLSTVCKKVVDKLIKEAQVGVVNHGRVITRLLKKFAKFGSLDFRGDINLIFQSFSHKKSTQAKI